MVTVETRPLGNSGLHISALGLGAMTFGGGGRYTRIGSLDQDAANSMVSACLDNGIFFFDTANSYSAGASETILGKAIGSKRDQAIVATKGFARIAPGPNNIGAGRNYLVRACEESLRRLGTDYIDLYQLHNFDSMTPLEETLAALESLVRSGKVRYIGVSNYAAWHLMKALGISDRLRVSRFCSQQVKYSLLSREIEAELVPLSLDQGVGVIVWSPLEGGLLSGKYRRDVPAPEGSRLSGAVSHGQLARVHDMTDLLLDLAGRHGATAGQIALSYILHKPGVSSVLIGAKNEEQLVENLRAASIVLDESEIELLDRASEIPWSYPVSMYATYGGERNPYYLRGRTWQDPMGGRGQ